MFLCICRDSERAGVRVQERRLIGASKACVSRVKGEGKPYQSTYTAVMIRLWPVKGAQRPRENRIKGAPKHLCSGYAPAMKRLPWPIPRQSQGKSGASMA